jgi:hypothetical protein
MNGGEWQGAEDRVSHLTETELAAFLDGRVTPAERRRVEAHIDICDGCRRELVDVGRAVVAPVVQLKATSKPPTRRWWIPAAIAAGVVALLVAPRATTRPPPRDRGARAPHFTDERLARIAIISPPDDVTVSAHRIVFTWHAFAADVYQLSLLSESGDPIWEKEITDTIVALPASVKVTAGTGYFWRVDAIANGIVATTNAHRLQISRE